MNPKPISETSNFKAGCGPTALTLFGAIFFLAGLFFFWMIVISPVLLWNNAKQWPSAEATITASKIIENHDSDGSSYRASFTYKYAVQGEQFTNDRYGLLKWSGSRKHAAKLKKQHPVGSKTTAYYNPADPNDSLMNRTLGWSILFGLLPLVFIAVGGFVMWGALTGWSVFKSAQEAKLAGAMSDNPEVLPNNLTAPAGVHSSGKKAPLLLPADNEDQALDGPQKLEPEQAKWVVLTFVAFFAIFWNSFICIFAYHVFADAGGGFGRIAMGLFLTPFVVVGIGLIGFSVYTLMAMFNPKVEIAISNGAVPLGGEFDVAWEIRGNVGRIRNLKIEINGSESATYQRGTNTYTDNETFKELPVVSTGVPGDIRFGSATVFIPETTMHTLDTGQNQIKWSVEVVGDIPFWPDIRESFTFRVKP